MYEIRVDGPQDRFLTMDKARNELKLAANVYERAIV